jgi:hypothetical protein
MVEEGIHDLEAGVQLAMVSITSLRAELAEVRGVVTSLHRIHEWIGRVYTWARNSARHFPWN